jgi:hypothetical protein
LADAVLALCQMSLPISAKGTNPARSPSSVNGPVRSGDQLVAMTAIVY